MDQVVAIRPPTRGIPRGRQNLRDLDHLELAAWLTQQALATGLPRHRAEQIFRWLHHRRATEFAAMTDLPADERVRLHGIAVLDRLQLDAVYTARDGTRKLQLRTSDGAVLESVLIPNADRGYTQCISSQVGCALTCRFCATASLGFLRNLATFEIVDQLYQAQDLLTREAITNGQQWPERITNVVFMGMGEPLHNYNQVKRAVAIFTDRAGAGLAGRRITISSSGLVPAIERFAKDLALDVGLAISLNATTDTVRDQVMPINTRWNIAALLAAVRAVPAHRRRFVTFEYVLLADINDSDADARRLADLVGDMRCQVNAIPFNPHPHAPYRRPTPARVAAFVARCRALGLHIYLRTPRGDDIGAACGQLARDGHPQPSAQE